MAHHIGILRAVTQEMIHQHNREHGLGNRCGAYADAGIVSPLGADIDRLAIDIDAATRQVNARGL